MCVVKASRILVPFVHRPGEEKPSAIGCPSTELAHTCSIALAKPDWEIKEDIQDELFWSPFVDADEVTVTVEDGVATLTGSGDNADEWASAVPNAREAGAIRVRNNLRVYDDPDFGLFEN